MGIPTAYLKVNCLVVDDELTMRQTIKNMLTRLGFKTVFVSENGRKALEFIKTTKLDIVIADVNMPEMTGTELFKAVREDKKYDSLNFIFVTAEARRETVAQIAEGAGNEYIIKPFVMGTLEDKLEKVLTKRFNPSEIDLYLRNFKLHLDNKDLQKAEENLDKAAMLLPENATISYNFGQLSLAKGDVNGAIEFFKEAIEKKPMFVKAYNAIGGIYESLGDHESAIKYYELAYNISPANTERLLSLSKLYQKTGETEKAETLLVDAQSDVREDASTSGHLLGEMYLAKNENEKALEVLLKTRRKNSSDISISMSLAEAYRKVNKPEDAVSIYLEIIKISPANANAYYNMGKACIEMGNKEKAIAALKKAWELNPFSKEIITDLKALAEKDKLAL